MSLGDGRPSPSNTSPRGSNFSDLLNGLGSVAPREDGVIGTWGFKVEVMLVEVVRQMVSSRKRVCGSGAVFGRGGGELTSEDVLPRLDDVFARKLRYDFLIFKKRVMP